MAATIAVVAGVLVFALGGWVGAMWEYSRKGGTYDTAHELWQVPLRGSHSDWILADGAEREGGVHENVGIQDH